MAEKEDSGFVMISNELIDTWAGTTQAFMVYCIIKRYNPSFPSYSKISEQSGLARATVSRCVKELSGNGLITYEKGSSKRKSNQYTVTSKKNELVQNLNQFKNCTTTSSKFEPQLVQNLNSNNTKEIKLKNKTKERATNLKILKGPIKEFDRIENRLTLDILNNVSHQVQFNWLDIYKDKGLDWITERIVEGVSYYFAKGESEGKKINYSLALGNWLRIGSKNPSWDKGRDNFDSSFIDKMTFEGGD